MLIQQAFGHLNHHHISPMAEKPEDLNLPHAVITRLIKEVVSLYLSYFQYAYIGSMLKIGS